MNLRPEVKRFACEMERVLRRNDYKGGWKHLTREELMSAIQLEVDELKYSFDDIIGCPDEEAVDVANFAMMIFDNLKGGRIG